MITKKNKNIIWLVLNIGLKSLLFLLHMADKSILNIQ